MEISEAIDIVNKSFDEERNRYFIVTLENGNRVKKRLFVSSEGNLCEYYKRSQRKGYIVSCIFWQKVEPISCDRVIYFRRNLTRIIQYLKNSGFWQDIMPGLVKFEKLTTDEAEHLYQLSYKEQEQYLIEHNIKYITVDMMLSLYQHDCIKTVRYTDVSWIKERYLKAIADNKDWQGRWRGNYDYCIELKMSDGNKRAWYSEEYKNCGNGYYYLLLDDKHVTFKEKD